MRRASKNEIKLAVKLKQKKYRRCENLVIVEGKRLVDQIMQNGILPKQIFHLENTKVDYPQIDSAVISQDDLKRLTFTQNPQELVAVVPTTTPQISTDKILLYLDDISEPGNLGTIFRTAAATKINGIILSENCCDIWNDKVIRSSMGTIFSVPSTTKSLDWLLNQEAHIIASTLTHSRNLFESKLTNNQNIIVLGNEAFGVNEKIIQASHETIHIPMYNGIESLNVAVAAGIILFHYNLQL